MSLKLLRCVNYYITPIISVLVLFSFQKLFYVLWMHAAKLLSLKLVLFSISARYFSSAIDLFLFTVFLCVHILKSEKLPSKNPAITFS